jgi:hypothetical protein
MVTDRASWCENFGELPELVEFGAGRATSEIEFCSRAILMASQIGSKLLLQKQSTGFRLCVRRTSQSRSFHGTLSRKA